MTNTPPQSTSGSCSGSAEKRFVFKDDRFGPRVADLKSGRWMSVDLVREMFDAIPKRKRGAAEDTQENAPEYLVRKARAALNVDEDQEISIGVVAWITDSPEEGSVNVHQFGSFLTALAASKGA